MKNVNEIKGDLATFDWNSVNKNEDAIGASQWGGVCYVYILKGFRKDTNNYTRIDFHVHPTLFYAIWDEAMNHAADAH
jgi:hypothetical protein